MVGHEAHTDSEDPWSDADDDAVSDALTLAVARAIRAERVRLGMSQDDLAAKLGVHRNTLGAMETMQRQVKISELPELCDALGLTLDQLLVRAPEDDRRKLGFRA